jgi:hypothetical protein
MLKRTNVYVALLALTLLPRAVAAQTPAAAPASEQASERWTTRPTTQMLCLEPTDTTVHARLRAELRHVQFPDSTAAVDLALRALGGRAENPMARVTAYKRAPNGILVAFDLHGALSPEKRASIRDGSATVYVHNSGCVTLLGW